MQTADAAADGLSEPITYDLHQSQLKLLEKLEILSLHAVRRFGRERQLHLKIWALCGEVGKVFNLLVDTGAQVSLVKAGLISPECLTTSWRPVRLKYSQYIVGETTEGEITLQFVNHCELRRLDLSKEFLLEGNFYEAQMDWENIIVYNFLIETDSGALLAQASMTLYQNHPLAWLLSPEHHVECQGIHPEGHRLEVASLGIEAAGPTYQECGVKPEVTN